MQKNDEQRNNDSLDKQQILLGILKDMKDNLENAINILGGLEGVRGVKIEDNVDGASSDGARIVEGVFAGDKMVGGDGKTYDIPPNYASKSKLVEGDILKLTITSNGGFVYKQIGPIPRKRLVGELAIDAEKDEFWVVVDTNKWRVLKASITYFKGEAGNKVAILVPQDGISKWAAVENVIKEGEE
ncbi:MAG: hypothetical protein WC459_03175 [Patescibacteria group bacterium]